MKRIFDNLIVEAGILAVVVSAAIEVAPLAARASDGSRPPEATEGFVPLFDGRSFDGWKFEPQFAGHWVARDGAISCDGKVQVKRGGERNLWTEKEYGDFVMIVDWRLTRKPERAMMNAFAPDGEFLRDANGKVKKHEILNAGDSGIYVRGSARAQVNIWSQPMGSGDINSYHKDLKLPAEIRRACVPSKNADKPFGQWNRFVITVRGDRISVVLNGAKVIDNALLPEVPRSGAIALQNHTDPVEFRNLYIKECD